RTGIYNSRDQNLPCKDSQYLETIHQFSDTLDTESSNQKLNTGTTHQNLADDHSRTSAEELRQEIRFYKKAGLPMQAQGKISTDLWRRQNSEDTKRPEKLTGTEKSSLETSDTEGYCPG
ncbi:hypothetical protein EK904_011651, partial [Melospiza melodia maxima]